jgi:hypothetical protein
MLEFFMTFSMLMLGLFVILGILAAIWSIVKLFSRERGC